MKFSIVMPVYNGEAFISNAIESILNQTYRDFELILVNDASVDKSAEICDSYSKDPRVVVRHNQVNMGISATRNVGLSIARGEYIGFSDDDDLCSPDMLQKTFEYIQKYPADMIKFGKILIDVDRNGKEFRIKKSKINKLYYLSGPEMYISFFNLKKLGIYTNVWNGFYKNSILKKYDIRFDETMKFGSEDAAFTYQCFLNSENFLVVPDVFYTHYRRDSISTSRHFNMNKIDSVIKTARIEREIWERMPQTAHNKSLIICHQNKYIWRIFSKQVFHRDADLDVKQQADLLKKLTEKKPLDYSNSDMHEILRNLKRMKYLHYILAKSIFSKKYLLVVLALRLAYNLRGDKW